MATAKRIRASRSRCSLTRVSSVPVFIIVISKGEVNGDACRMAGSHRLGGVLPNSCCCPSFVTQNRTILSVPIVAKYQCISGAKRKERDDVQALAEIFHNLRCRPHSHSRAIGSRSASIKSGRPAFTAGKNRIAS
jgi:hypothetical protein